MSVQVHPSSVVSPEAVLGDGVVVGPFCVIEGQARIGAHTRLRSHVVIGSDTEIGEGNDFFPHCTLGMDPQDLKYQGTLTRLQVGNHNVFRESCTVHRGTDGGGGITRVGDGNFFMIGTHIAHDCRVGSGCVFANNATLAGHVEVGDGCIIEAFCAVHQFCRVGESAFMGAFTGASMDVLPFMKTVGTREVKSHGVNTLGLRRKGLPEATVTSLSHAHHLLFHSDLLREEGLARVEQELGDIPEVKVLIRFMRESKRGVHRG